MDKKYRLNSNVFNYEANPLFTREYASSTILFNTFSTAQTNTAIWTPAAGKRIYLTAIEAASLGAVTLSLLRASSQTFLSIVLTSASATYGQSFFSPVRFAPNEVISLTTNASGTVYITLLGYEV